jgi:hypothetical protein
MSTTLALLVSQTLCFVVMTIACPAGIQRTSVGIMLTVALAQPLGEMLQTNMNVPAFIRWHLSDFGVVPFATFAATVIWHLVKDKRDFTIAKCFASAEGARIIILLTSVISTGCIGYELVLDNTDVIDIFMYVCSAGIVLSVYSRLYYRLVPRHTPSCTR